MISSVHLENLPGFLHHLLLPQDLSFELLFFVTPAFFLVATAFFAQLFFVALAVGVPPAGALDLVAELTPRRRLLGWSLGGLLDSYFRLRTLCRRRFFGSLSRGLFNSFSSLFDEPFEHRGKSPVLLAGDTGRLEYLGRRLFWSWALGVVSLGQGAWRTAASA
jgi:hypothetical protein